MIPHLIIMGVWMLTIPLWAYFGYKAISLFVDGNYSLDAIMIKLLGGIAGVVIWMAITTACITFWLAIQIIYWGVQ